MSLSLQNPSFGHPSSVGPCLSSSWDGGYRNKSSKRELNAFANIMITIGIIGLSLVFWGKQYDNFVSPILYPTLPGVMSGCLIGADSVWIWGLYKRRRSKNKNSPVPDS